MQSKTISQPARNTRTLNHVGHVQDTGQRYLLRSQQMSSVISTSGSGGLFFDDLAITRWRNDSTADAEGVFVYLRDLDNGEFWSAGYQPTLREPEESAVRCAGQSLEFSRLDQQIQFEMKICLAADCNVELRSCTLTNHDSKPRRLELTSYAELVLQDARADAAHLAFSKLFIETQLLDSGALLARRRQRQAGEEVVSAIAFLAGYKLPSVDLSSVDEFETDRNRFIGRGRDVSSPWALQSSNALSGAVGSVLDPVFSLRKVITIAPGESAMVVFGLGAGLSAEQLPELAARFADPDVVAKTFQTAANAAQQPELLPQGDKHWRLDAAVAATPSVHHLPEPTNSHANGEVNFDGKKVRDFSPAGGEAASDYLANADALVVQNGEVTPEKLQFDNGWGGFSADGTEYVIHVEPLSERETARPPLPWVNIIANPQFGFIASESGAGYTWSGNSRLNRLTPWQNDPVCDPHSEALYIRDDELGVFWSPTPGPVEQRARYEVRHGFGYTKFSHTSHQLRQEVEQFVPREDAVKITCVRLQNLSDQPRRLSLFSYHQWDLSDGNPRVTRKTQTAIHPEQHAIFATNDQRGEFSSHVAYSALVPGQTESRQSCTGSRAEFLGQNGRLADPRALQTSQPLSGTAGAGLDPCAACQATVEIAPGETLLYVVLLGESPSQADAESVLGRYQSAEQCRQALADVQAFWREKLSAVQIQTPSPAIDLLVNGWLPYQNLSCRLWGRSSTYQSGGAYGFRDQLQDAAALVHHWPALTREQILRNASHQFAEGDVLHWWHPPQSLGIRTNFADDLLWMPLFAAEYVESTGDESLWHEQVRFLTSPPVPDGAAEVMLTPNDSGDTGSVYEHCCRALDQGLTTGHHGLPLMGCGDWNDGMNRVGQGGTGESVWLGFFIDYILERMLPVCEQFGDESGNSERLERYRDYREKLRASLNDAGWDGEWYRRAYFDNGAPLGTAGDDECQIDALVQAWAVMSGAAPPDRAEQAMAAATARLVDKQAGLIQLLDPPFNKMPQDPGYIKGYLPGIRENGGQYTHGVLWFIRAVAELGQGSQAVELLEMLSPINHGRNAEEVMTYQAEPYVIAADVYSQSPHAGRAGWSWYTGSAGWMFRVAVESVLGIQLRSGDTLRIDPRISADWPECRVHYCLPDGKTRYEIVIQNPQQRQSGVTSAQLDGQALPVQDQIAEIPLHQDGGEHRVVVVL